MFKNLEEVKNKLLEFVDFNNLLSNEDKLIIINIIKKEESFNLTFYYMKKYVLDKEFYNLINNYNLLIF